MNSLAVPVYASALTLCLFSAGVLGGRKARSGGSLRYFTLFLGIEALGFVFELLMDHPATPLKALWLGLRLANALLVAPCLWLAIRELAEGETPSLAALSRTERGAILAGFLLTLPLMASAHLGTRYYNSAHVPSRLVAHSIHAAMLLCIGIFAVQVPVYVRRCRRLLMERVALAHAGGANATKWIHLPLIIVFTAWVSGIVRTVQGATHAPLALAELFALVEVSVTVGALYLIVRRIARMPVLAPAETTEAGATAAVADVAAAGTKYAKCTLDAAVRHRIGRKIEVALTADEVYRHSLLSLRSLSAAIKEKPHYVSQVINQDLGSSFYQLVNRHRIERAKRLLADCSDRTVIEIALAVGFNSKSTFNTAFRTNVGMTPREYRLMHGAPPDDGRESSE